jgi:hypothetical protein
MSLNHDDQDATATRRRIRPCLNGAAEPGAIVVGSTPFKCSASAGVTRSGLVPSALAVHRMQRPAASMMPPAASR